MPQDAGHRIDAAKFLNDPISVAHTPISYAFAVMPSTWKAYEQKGIVLYVKDVPVTTRLKELRERADLSMADMARILKLKGPSSYQRYEDPNKFTRRYLPHEKIDLLIQIVGRGKPAITLVEVKALGGSVDRPSSAQAFDAFLSFSSVLTGDQRRELLKALKRLEEDDNT